MAVMVNGRIAAETDSETLAADREMHVWHRKDQRFERHFTIESSTGVIDKMRLSPDDRYLGLHIVGENAIRLWDLVHLKQQFESLLNL